MAIGQREHNEHCNGLSLLRITFKFVTLPKLDYRVAPKVAGEV